MGNKIKLQELIYSVMGGKVLLFGDTHLSSSYTGSHKNYMENCLVVMKKIKKIVKANNPSAIVLLGDLFGVHENNIKDRRFLLEVHLFLSYLNKVTSNNVYAVKGNHDMGNFSDFDFFIGTGLIKNPDYVDYKGASGVEVRFHFVNYGHEDRKLSILDGASNVVLGHMDYQIGDLTGFYRTTGKQVELTNHEAYKGVDLVISGHIHLPSEEVLTTTICGKEVGLFYPGCPTRVKERYEDCWYVTFEYDKESETTDYTADLIGLEKVANVFNPKDKDIKEELTEEQVQSRSLQSIVKEILEGNMMRGDIFTQIDCIPYASKEVKEKAKDYMRKAIEEVN